MNSSTFAALGLMINQGFLTGSETETIKKIAENLPGEHLGIVRGGEQLVDRETRAGHSLTLPFQWEEAITNKLNLIQSRIEERYKIILKGFERIQLLAYGPEHFFKPHCDSSDEECAPAYVRARQVTAVIPISRPGLDWHGGGDLIMYGLIKQIGFENCGLTVPLIPGDLVTFPAGELHEVSAIKTGKRLSLVTWFYS